MKRPTIEGLPSPAPREARSRDAGPQTLQLDLVRSVKMHPRLTAGVAAGVFVLLLLYGLSRTKMYLAESLTYIEPLASKVLSDGASGTYDPSRYDSYLQQQMLTALRPDILAIAIAKLPPGVWQRSGESTQAAVARLQQSLKVQRVLTSYQLSIDLVDANPQTAASVVNAVTNAYLEQGRKDEHAVIDQRLQVLAEERQRIQQQLSEDRVEQAELGSVLGMANPTGTATTQYDAQIAGVQTQVAGAREARDVAAAQLASLQGLNGGASPALDAAADEQLQGDAGLNSMKQTINQRKAELSTKMAGLTPTNPIYRQDGAEIADLDRSLDVMTQQVRERTARRLQEKMRADLRRTADIEGRLNAQLREQTNTATTIAPKLQRASALAADLDRLTARYTVVDDAMRGLQLESSGPGSAHLSVAATVPVTPEPSRRRLILLLALPLGLLAGLFAAVLAQRLDPRIYSGKDVEKVLGFLPIGVMPAEREVSSRVMEEYALRLAAGLQSAYRVSSAQSFVFTAASSTMEISAFVKTLERILGSLGFSAIVMDASHVLRSASDTESGLRGVGSFRTGALVRTIEGVRQGYAGEELDRLKLKHDLLLIDAPPLLHSAETEYLVRCADATILVAESGVTIKSELFQSALLLQQLNVAGVGAVLQELHLKDADDSFRAAIAAVERIQRSRHEGNASTPQVAPSEAESVTESRVEAMPEVPNAVNAEEVADSAVCAADGAVREPARVVERVQVEESSSVEEPDSVRPWREILKRVPEAAAEEVQQVEERGEQSRPSEEPVLYFEDRLRAKRSVDRSAAVAEVEPAILQREPEGAAVVDLAEAEETHAVAQTVMDLQAIEQAGGAPEVAGLYEPEWALPVYESVAPSEGLREENPVEIAGAAEAEPSALAAEREREPLAVEIASEAKAAEIVLAGEPAAATAEQVPAVRREPSAPRMGWFTLKFRGTSERVLRVIPGEEGDEIASVSSASAPVPSLTESSEPEPVADVGAEPVAATPMTIEEGVHEPVEHLTQEGAEAPEKTGVAEVEQGFESEWSKASEEMEHSVHLHPVSDAQQESIEKKRSEPLAGEDEALAVEAAGSEAVEEPDTVAYGSVAESTHVQEFAVHQVADDGPEEMHEPELAMAETVLVPQAAVQEAEFTEESAVTATTVEGWSWRESDTPAALATPAWGLARLPRNDDGITAADHLAPARLVGELRSRSAGAAKAAAIPAKNWSRRSVGAPVEERLETNSASLTRRWEMLSRFDLAQDGKKPVESVEANPAVPTVSERGGR